MEAAEIIDSGLLEAYVLGLASAEEQQAIEKAIRQSPSMRSELEEIEWVMENIADRFSIAPGGHVKKEIEISLFPPQPTQAAEPQRAMPKRRSLWSPISIAASIALVVACGVVFLQHGKLKKSKERIISLENQSADLQIANEQIENQLTRMASFTRNLEEPGAKQVILTSTLQQASKAIVFWNPNTHKVWLVNTNLPALPEDKQYQMWGIVDGKPVDGGVFDGGSEKAMVAVELKSISKPSLFAVTIEKRGGASSPTLSTMCLKAEI